MLWGGRKPTPWRVDCTPAVTVVIPVWRTLHATPTCPEWESNPQTLRSERSPYAEFWYRGKIGSVPLSSTVSVTLSS